MPQRIYYRVEIADSPEQLEKFLNELSAIGYHIAFVTHQKHKISKPVQQENDEFTLDEYTIVAGKF
jgi:ACT domain-containing protein